MQQNDSLPKKKPPSLPETATEPPPTMEEHAQNEVDGGERRTLTIVAIGAFVLAALLGTGIFFLLQPTTDTAKIRDVFIIFMALESLFIGFTLVILIIQIARLINLLQNEIKPILDSTNETVSTLRGTAAFLSDNLAEPVVKLQSYVAALQKLADLIRLKPRK